MFSGQDENGTWTIQTKMCLSALVSFTKCILWSYFWVLKLVICTFTGFSILYEGEKVLENNLF